MNQSSHSPSTSPAWHTGLQIPCVSCFHTFIHILLPCLEHPSSHFFSSTLLGIPGLDKISVKTPCYLRHFIAAFHTYHIIMIILVAMYEAFVSQFQFTLQCFAFWCLQLLGTNWNNNHEQFVLFQIHWSTLNFEWLRKY